MKSNSLKFENFLQMENFLYKEEDTLPYMIFVEIFYDL